MECISVFDMLKIGVGPSSSHTLGPWRAAERWLHELKEEDVFKDVTRVQVDLYGSLSLTGKGHATDLAVMLGLSGSDPEYIPTETIDIIIASIENTKKLVLGNEKIIDFDRKSEIVFNRVFLPFHSNAITFTAFKMNTEIHQSNFYSIGGGFVINEERTVDAENKELKKKFLFL